MSRSGRRNVPPSAQKLREKMADDHEPLHRADRIVQKFNGLYINLTDYGAMTGDVEKGDELEVHVYREGIVIPFGRGGGPDE